MTLVLAAGTAWLRPVPSTQEYVDVHFVERAEQARCRNVHTMVRLSDVFANIMPWLSSVGAGAAAGDYDNDGYPDLYVVNSGRGDSNVLYRNRGDGTFQDETDSAGVGCGNPHGASMHAIWGDVDNDGHFDLYVVKWAEPNQLFHNNGDGTFTDVSARSGAAYWGYANAATFLDYDRNGWIDLLVGNYFAEAVRDPDTGRLARNDLWNPVTTRVMHETFTHADNGGRNVLYRNRGDGTFEDVTEAVGLTYTGWTLAVGSGDLNNDGWPDLYLANDFGPDEFYLNTGATEDPPRFRPIVDPKGHPGVGNDWWKGMNVDIADVNNDGYLDIYVTNILERRYKTDEGNMLWLNCLDPTFPGGRGFRNIAKQSATFDGGWGWGGKFADFNNDGLMDIYTVNGFVTGDGDHNYWYRIQEMVTQTKNQTADARDWPEMGDRDLSGHERGRLFVQIPRDSRAADDNTPRFVEAAMQAGIVDRYNGRGIALADFNLDGRVDMYIANQGAPAAFYMNVSGSGVAEGSGLAQNGFLRLRLRGRPDAPVVLNGRGFASTADSVGARVSVESVSGLQIREVQGGMGFASQSEHCVHFGIARRDVDRRVTVRWPSGRRQVFEGDAARALVNRHTTIEEPVFEVAHR
ncbi:MAG: CRTAC1 family protein [Phycisphaerae bacterium]